MNRGPILFVLALLIATPAYAVDIWQCRMAESQATWLGEGLAFAHDGKNDSAIVADAVVASHNNGQPERIRTTGGGDRPLKMRWQVRNVRAGNGVLINTLVYRATFRADDGSIILNVNAPGHSVNLSRKGRCGLVTEAQRRNFLRLLER